MREFGIYLLESAVCLMVFYLLYYILLRKETFFTMNRFVLLGSVILSLLIPLLNISLPEKVSDRSLFLLLDTAIPVHAMPEVYVNGSVRDGMSVTVLIWTVYLGGLVFFSLRFILQFLQIFRYTRKYGILKLNGRRIVPVDKEVPPFSFFHLIFINRSELGNPNLDKILLHETEHARKLHSADVLLFELLTIAQWFNPVVWLYSYSVREIHEYQADNRVIRTGVSKINYVDLIMEQLFGSQFLRIANYLSRSIIKNRITMMTRIESKKAMMTKMLFIIPAALFLAGLFSFTVTGFNEISVPGVYQPAENFHFPLNTADITRISNGYGPMINPITRKEQVHKAIDVTAKTGTPVFAAREGEVTLAAFDKGYGNNIIIVHDEVYLSRYAHLDQMSVKAGQRVSKGQVIGTVGNTGLSTAPHLHFEIMKNSENVDPLEFFPWIKTTNPSPVVGLDGNKPGTAVKVNMVDQDPKVYDKVDKAPEYPDGGTNGFRGYLMKNVIYPETARAEKLEGRVFVTFIIDEKGLVNSASATETRDLKTEKKISAPALEKEAVRVITSSPPWIPGKLNGQKVKVRYTVPITFSLGETSEKNVVIIEKIGENKNEPDSDEPVFTVVEEMPQYGESGSQDAFRQYIAEKLVYPEEALKKRITGKVFVSFVVEADGSVSTIAVEKGVHPLLDEEAVRVIRECGPWKAGKQRGQHVRVAYTFPIVFALQ